MIKGGKLCCWEFCGVHVENFPSVTIEVFDGALLHEAVVAHFVWFDAAGGEAFGHDVVDFVDASDGEGEESGNIAFCISDWFLCKGFEFFVRHDHHEDVVAPGHAFGGVVGKLRVIGET